MKGDELAESSLRDFSLAHNRLDSRVQFVEAVTNVPDYLEQQAVPLRVEAQHPAVCHGHENQSEQQAQAYQNFRQDGHHIRLMFLGYSLHLSVILLVLLEFFFFFFFTKVQSNSTN